MVDKILSAFFLVASAFLLVSQVDAAPRDVGFQAEIPACSMVSFVSVPSSSNEE